MPQKALIAASAVVLVAIAMGRPVAADCIANTLPGNSDFCVTQLDQFSFHCHDVQGIAWHISMTCNNGRKWHLSCRGRDAWEYSGGV